VYGKVFTAMFDGTLATKGPWQALVTFQQLIALADRKGIVDMTPEAISRRTTIPLEIIETGIAALEAPDPDSRSPDHDGRRIVRLAEHRSWGWQLVNYEHYRAIRSADERREYMKLYQRDYRKDGPKGAVNQTVNSVSGINPCSKQMQKQETPSAADAAAKQKKLAISFDESIGQLRFITAGDMARWATAYPALNLESEIAKAEAWLVANPKNRKSNNARFLTNWLSRAQDKAPRAAGKTMADQFPDAI
jgi:hypothetical protein